MVVCHSSTNILRQFTIWKKNLIRCPIYNIYKNKDEVLKMKNLKIIRNYRDYFCGLGFGKDVISNIAFAA